MARRSQLPDNETNLLLTSGLILLISLIIAAMAYFSFSLEILDPPGISHAPGRNTASDQNHTGIAAPGLTDSDPSEEAAAEPGFIRFPGFVDFSITYGKDTIDLKNDASNTVTMVFTISDADGKPLYTTKPINPGDADQWSVLDAHEPGTGKFTYTITVDTFSLADGSARNSTSTDVTVNYG